MTNFQKAIKFIALWEWRNDPDGAYTNDPIDPGGETKYGIAKKAHPELDIKELTFEQAMEIYKQEYWIKFGCDALPFPFAVAAFDCFVQHRPSVVQGWLKPLPTLQQLLETRRIFYLKLIEKNPSLDRFRKGWLRRLNDLSTYCAILAQEESPPS